MDDRRFDAIARALGSARSRRGAIGLLAGAAAVGGLDAAEGTDAKSHRKHGDRRRPDRHRGDGGTPAPADGDGAVVSPAKKKKKCKNGLARCKGQKGCFNLQTDPFNCGGCGQSCGTELECHAGSCACGPSVCQGCCDGTACRAGTDPGACGRGGGACSVCPDGGVCADGGCGCPNDRVLCDDACVDPSGDHANCGWCGHACADGETCCGGACASLDTTADCGACGRACGDGGQCCGGDCVHLGTAAHCAACGDACDQGKGCCGGVCTPLDTTANCGACGTVCPGVGQPAATVTCQGGTICTFTCQGDHYDADGNPGNGCEVDGIGNHTQATAASASPGVQSCEGATNMGGFVGVIASDGRAHDPAVDGFNPSTGAAPHWWTVRATGGQCPRNIQLTFSMSRATRGCYQLTIITDVSTQHGTSYPVVWNGYDEDTFTGGGAYTPGTDVYFLIEKTCPVSTAREAAIYSVSYHL